jgi:hypothetical protein
VFIVTCCRMHCYCPCIGNQYIVNTEEEAIDLALKIVQEQLQSDKGESPELVLEMTANIKKELSCDYCYHDEDNEWSVAIGIPEDNKENNDGRSRTPS